MTDKQRQKFKEIAEFIYGDDETAIECAMEDLDADGFMFVFNNDEFAFKKPLSAIEEACWVRGFVFEVEGGGYAVKIDEEAFK